MVSPPEDTESCRKTKTNKNAKEKKPTKPKQSRPRKNSSGDMSTDSCGTASLTDDSSQGCTSPSPRRRQRNRGRKSKQSQQKENPASDITDAEKSRYVAMDCEMVGVGDNGLQSVVARVTLVNWDGDVILDEYVRPDYTITDYRTFVSGITENDLVQRAHLSLPACRKLVLQHLHGKVLVGHALKNDLHALGIRHPWQDTRDTAKYEPFMKVRFDDGVLWPRKLKELVFETLSREIQHIGAPHCPYEDAVAAMDLYKRVRAKWEKVMDYKIKRTAEIERKQLLVVSQAA